MLRLAIVFLVVALSPASWAGEKWQATHGKGRRSSSSSSSFSRCCLSWDMGSQGAVTTNGRLPVARELPSRLSRKYGIEPDLAANQKGKWLGRFPDSQGPSNQPLPRSRRQPRVEELFLRPIEEGIIHEGFSCCNRFARGLRRRLRFLPGLVQDVDGQHGPQVQCYVLGGP